MRGAIGVFEVRDVDLAARIGRLYTPHGILETPALLPVIDIERQELPVAEIKEIGFRGVITNAYLLWRRMRDEVIEKGVHKVLGFDGVVMTDSGGYQILRYRHVEIDPLEVVSFQKLIGSDLAVILDVPSGASHDRGEAEYAVAETLRRAILSLNEIDPENRVWVLPVQGGPYPDLVEKSARESAKLPKYQVYALGSPTVVLERYNYEVLVEMVYRARLALPPSKPLHLFGAGHPMILPFVVALGVDLFDSASYIIYARDGRYMTLSRTYRLEDLDYFPCSCPVCLRYQPRELLEMPYHERVRLLAKHNLFVLHQAVNEVRVAIREGRLWELLEERSRAHPSLYRAFRMFRRYIDYLERNAPRVKAGEVHGLFLYGLESTWRPEIVRHRRYVRTRVPRRSNVLTLVPLDVDDKPLTSSRIYLRLKHMLEGDVAGYVPYLVLVPIELSETYPLSQFEAPRNPSSEVIDDLVQELTAYIQAKGYSKVIIYWSEKLDWSYNVAKRVESMLKGKVATEIRKVEDYM
jgi:7-cyano-7-deazaguanine tRNA-ribosyltransferase